MGIADSKNRWIGFLSSILLHLLLAAALYLFILNDRKERPKIERMSLDIGQFETAQTKQTADARQTPKTLKSQNTVESAAEKPKRERPKEPKEQTKIPQEKKASAPQHTKQAKRSDERPMFPGKQTAEQNKSASKESPKSSQSPLLSALNSEFKASQKETPAGGRIKKLYGEEFERMGKEEQKFIKDNLGSIGKITEKYLRYPDVSAKLRQQGASVVEFFLHPNGDITDLKLLTTSGYKALDKNSIETIELAYKDYPRPSAKTKIRIYVEYSIY